MSDIYCVLPVQVGDLINHGVYETYIEQRHIPLLTFDPPTISKYQLTAEDIMSRRIHAVSAIVNVRRGTQRVDWVLVVGAAEHTRVRSLNECGRGLVHDIRSWCGVIGWPALHLPPPEQPQRIPRRGVVRTVEEDGMCPTIALSTERPVPDPFRPGGDTCVRSDTGSRFATVRGTILRTHLVMILQAKVRATVTLCTTAWSGLEFRLVVLPLAACVGIWSSARRWRGCARTGVSFS